MGEENRRDMPPAGGDRNVGLEKLLEERARLEELIHRKFTRTITVMFTDFKGSTALAETEGDMASRLLIKKHHDILFPLIEQNRGILVKTMGDGTLSWFENPIDGIRAAAAFQSGLMAFNQSRPGKTPIIVRIGLNTGTGIVEENDVFGDAVNVAARFESIAGPGEICISESCFEGIGNDFPFRCRFVKTAELKGKTGLHKVYKVYWNDDEPFEPPIESAATDPTPANGSTERAAALPNRTGASRLPGVAPRTPFMFRAPVAEPRKRLDTGWIAEEREALAQASLEVRSLVIRQGEAHRLADDGYRVMDDIRVDPGGLLVIENAKLFFAAGAGIVSSGAVRAKNTLFSAIDQANGWRNVSLDPRDDRVNLVEKCTFRFGKGRNWESMPTDFGERHRRIREDYLYGGGLLIRKGNGKNIPVTGCAFHRCTANEGGGVFLYNSQAVLSNCTFEHNRAGGSGGGIFCLGGSPALRSCGFKDCAADLGGGGAGIISSQAEVDRCGFERCTTRHTHGGGILCTESDPVISGCRFLACSAGREGGGIHRDPSSSPRVVNTTFAGCTPSDTNFATSDPSARSRNRFL